MDRGSDFEALPLSARREQFDDAFNQSGDVEGFLNQFEFAGLDLGKIENFVDQRGQGRAGGADRLDIVALFGFERRIAEQIRHAQNAIERGADLMAHGCEEAGFGLVGGLSPLTGGSRFLQFPDFVTQIFKIAMMGGLPAADLELLTPETDGKRHRKGKTDDQKCCDVGGQCNVRFWSAAPRACVASLEDKELWTFGVEKPLRVEEIGRAAICSFRSGMKQVYPPPAAGRISTA